MEKETNLIIRVSPADKETIKKKAENAKISVSEYARKMMLLGKVIKIDPQDRATLNGIANNLNQLTRFTNQTHSVSPETENVLKELIKEIRNAYRKR